MDLQNLARQSRPTDELEQLYALEGFLARVAASEYAERFVFKGGVLLAAYGARRPTRDVDMRDGEMSNHTEDHRNSGGRTMKPARRHQRSVILSGLHPAQSPCHGCSAARSSCPVTPLPMTYAEKIVTALQRGTVNTRWRDFVDVFLLSGHHPVSENEIQQALAAVADYHLTVLIPLADVLQGYAVLARARWAA